MPFQQVDRDMFPDKPAFVIGANGGINLLDSKVEIDPGTLQDCLNYEVAREAGYKLFDGLMRFSGRAFSTVLQPICGDFDENDLAEGGKYVVATRQRSSTAGVHDVFVYERDEGTLSLSQSFRLSPGCGVDDRMAPQFSPNNEFVAIAHGGSCAGGTTISMYSHNEGVLSLTDNADINIQGYDVAWLNNNKLLLAHISSTIGFGLGILTMFSNSSGNISVLNTYFPPEINTNSAGRAVAASPDGSRALVHAVNTGDSPVPTTFLVDVSGETIIELDSARLVASVGSQSLSWHPTKPLVARCRSNGTVDLISVENDSIELLQTIAHSEPTTRGITWSPGGDFVMTALRVYKLVDNTLVLDNQGLLDVNSSGMAVDITPGGGFVITGRDSTDPQLHLFSFDKGSVELLGTQGGIDQEVRGLAFSNNIAPFTESGPDTTGGEYKVALASSPTVFVGTIKVIKAEEGRICYQIVEGTVLDLYEAGENLRIYPDPDDLTRFGIISNQAIVEYETANDFLVKYFEHNRSLAADSFRPPGLGPINVLFELGNRIHAARDIADQTGSQLYVTTPFENLAKEVEWEEVDMGYEVDFKEGKTEPFTVYDREFMEEELDPQEPVLDRLGNDTDSVWTIGASGSSTSTTANTGAWGYPENALEDSGDSISAEAHRTHSPTSTGTWFPTQILRITDFRLGTDVSPFAAITGIKVEVRYGFKLSHIDSDTNEREARMKQLTLKNVGTTDNKAVTTLRTQADNDEFFTVSAGGPTDLWGATQLSNSNVFSEDFGVDIVLESRHTTTTFGTTSRIHTHRIAFVKVSVYFEDGSEGVFFWDGSADVAQADVINVFKEKGAWDINTSLGTLTIYNVLNPEAIAADQEIRTASSGGGELLALAAGTADKNLLPSSADMAKEKSLARHIKANFFIDEEKLAIYGVTGAGPSFVYDGRFFIKNRAPIPVEKDKPRHIYEHALHLVLGYASGSILVSVPVEPKNFSGVDGASEFGFGDRITGLVGLSGNALGILCEESTHALLGNTTDNFTIQLISKSSGAIEYSVVNMGQPVYCDFRGISNIEATEQYGDFLWGRVSQLITDWLQPRLQEAVTFSPSLERIKVALPVRNKNQYRVFFNDGYILTLTMFGGQPEMAMFTLQHYEYDGTENKLRSRKYVPSAVLSTVLSTGQELNMIGTEDGDIYILDQGTGILTRSEITPYNAFLLFNPFNVGQTHLNVKYRDVLIHGNVFAGDNLEISLGTNYFAPEQASFKDKVVFGNTDVPVDLKKLPARTTSHLPSIADAVSLRIDSIAEGNLPHTIQALTYRGQPVSDKDSSPRKR